jgi:EmrB/QacA subfamily drug resistance transporter
MSIRGNLDTGPQSLGAGVWSVSLVVILGSMMSILDTTIINVALRTLGQDLHADVAGIQWVVTGYMLALTAVIPLTGWTARRFGGKRVYLVSLVLFTASSALCGLAPTLGALVACRVLQGIAGGMLMPIGQMMMAEAAGPDRMGRVMSIVGVPMMLAPVLGPTIGGAIVDHLSWRWIFYVNVPFGIIAVLAATRVLPKAARAAVDPLDVWGLVLLSAGVPLITYGLAELGQSGGLGSAIVVLPLVAGATLVALFVGHALRARHPLLDVRLYRRPTFASASLTMFSLGAALFGGMILLPLYLQSIRHQSAMDTGLLMAPQALAMALVMPLSGRLTDRFGGGPIALFGIAMTVLTTLPFTMIGAHTPIAELSLAMFARGIGTGFSIMPAMAAAYATLDRAEISHATPQLNVVQRTGGSIGTAVLAVVLQRALDGATSLDDAAAAYGTAFWWVAALAALAIVPAVVLLCAERAARGRRAVATLPTEAIVEAAV